MRKKFEAVFFIKETYDKIKKYLLFILVVFSLLGRYLNAPFAQDSATFAAVMICLNIFLEIYDKTVQEKTNITFPRFHDSSLHFRKNLEKLTTRRKIAIKWLGVSMNYGTSFLEDILNELSQIKKLEIIELEIVMLDPNWTEIKNVNISWASRMQGNFDALSLIKDRFVSLNKDKQLIFNLYIYQHVPNFHGFSVNDKYFYTGICTWHQGRLDGGESPYELVSANSDDPDSIRKIDLFLGWFEYCKQLKKI